MSAHTSGRSLSQVDCFIFFFWQIQYFLIYFASASLTLHVVGMQLIWFEQGADWKGAKIITSIRFSPRQTRIFLNKTWYNGCDLTKENNYWMWNFEVDELWQSVNYEQGRTSGHLGRVLCLLSHPKAASPNEHTPKSAKTNKQTNKWNLCRHVW